MKPPRTIDRGNPKLESLYDPLHPAFLRLLEGAAAQSRSAKRWLGICGEMAGKVELLPLLIGLGFDELSMAPGLIPAVKERLGELDSGECRALLQRAGRCADAGEVRQLLAEFNGRGGSAPIICPSGADPIGLPPRGAAGVIAAEWVSLDSPSRTPSEAIKELCGLLELAGRVSDASALEETVWKREGTSTTNLGFGFALPHGKSSRVRASSIAFLRPRRPIRWSGKNSAPVRAVLLIAVPEHGGKTHLRLIAGLSRRLMDEGFRESLFAAAEAPTVLALINSAVAVG
ncbi:MAG: PTS sugar transporter subunit IIA [Candidatus Aminicenantes bacterium]|nr:PTS sugar transporter subunit IIA [Candidatus Aminicenantes bacterium]